jgi:hypothetical protein
VWGRVCGEDFGGREGGGKRGMPVRWSSVCNSLTAAAGVGGRFRV